MEVSTSVCRNIESWKFEVLFDEFIDTSIEISKCSTLFLDEFRSITMDEK